MACGFKSHPGYKRILLNEMQNPFFFSYTKVSSGNCAPKEVFFCCCRCGLPLPFLFWCLVADSFEGCLFFVCSSIVFRFENEEESKNKRRRIEEETSPHQARPEPAPSAGQDWWQWRVTPRQSLRLPPSVNGRRELFFLAISNIIRTFAVANKKKHGEYQN